MKAGRRAGREDGFALLIVLWAVVLLSFIVIEVSTMARTETRIAANMRRAAEAEAAADGAVYVAIFHLLDRSGQRWFADDSTRVLRLPGGVARIRIENEADKINPNVASPELLQALLLQAGLAAPAASALAAAIVGWRTVAAGGNVPGPALADYQRAGRDVAPSGLPFGNIDELGGVLGMTPGLLAKLRPHLTVFSESDPGSHSRDAVVARAVAAAADGSGDAGGDDSDDVIASITVSVTASDGGRFDRAAVVEVVADEPGRPYTILDWGTPDDE